MNFRGSVWENPNHFGNPMMNNNNNNMNSQFSSPRSGPNKNFFNPGSYSNKQPSLTPEQIAFENEFSKWESSFSEWKRTYANHPDQSAFREYEKKFLDIRDKLLVKRTRVYGSNNTHSEFEAHLNAASSMAEHLMNFEEPPTRQIRFSNQGNNSGGNFNRNNSGGNFNQNLNRMINQQVNRGNQGNNNRFQPYQNQNNSNNQRFKKQSGGNIGNFLRSSSQVSGNSVGNNNQNQNLKNKQNNQQQQQQQKKKKTPGVSVQQAPMVHTVEDIKEKFEEARKEIAENKCPRFSGASRRKLTRLKEREPSTYDEAEKLFMEYAAFVHKERNEFLQRKNAQKADGNASGTASNDCPMEGQTTGTAQPVAQAVTTENQSFALD